MSSTLTNSFWFIAESNTATQEPDESAQGGDWKGGGRQQQQSNRTEMTQTPTGGVPGGGIVNGGKVKFDSPKVPVIFVLGMFKFILRFRLTSLQNVNVDRTASHRGMSN